MPSCAHPQYRPGGLSLHIDWRMLLHLWWPMVDLARLTLRQGRAITSPGVAAQAVQPQASWPARAARTACCAPPQATQALTGMPAASLLHGTALSRNKSTHHAARAFACAALDGPPPTHSAGAKPAGPSTHTHTTSRRTPSSALWQVLVQRAVAGCAARQPSGPSVQVLVSSVQVHVGTNKTNGGRGGA